MFGTNCDGAFPPLTPLFMLLSSIKYFYNILHLDMFQVCIQLLHYQPGSIRLNISVDQPALRISENLGKQAMATI